MEGSGPECEAVDIRVVAQGHWAGLIKSKPSQVSRYPVTGLVQASKVDEGWWMGQGRVWVIMGARPGLHRSSQPVSGHHLAVTMGHAHLQMTCSPCCCHLVAFTVP